MHSRTYSAWPTCPCGIPNCMAFVSHASYEATDDAAGFFFAADAGPLTATARIPMIASAKMRI